MDFKKWLQLQEVGTSTGCVAGFARISLPLIRRTWFGWEEEDPFFKKSKNKRKKLKEEFNESEEGSPPTPKKQFTGWTDERVKFWTGYASSRLFKSPEEAREWVFYQLQRNDQLSYASSFGGINGPEYNRAAADAMPVYQSGKSFKVGKKIRKDYRLKWDDIEIRLPNWTSVIQTAEATDVREFKVHKVDMVPIRSLLGPNDGNSIYSYGKESEYIKYLAQAIKTNRWFEPILYEYCENPYIMEGQHRVRAARLLGFTKVPGIGIEYHD
jgi:hypothetical protein